MIDAIWNSIEKAVIFLFKLILSLFHKKISNQDVENIDQFLKFGVVGVSNTIVSYVTYLISLYLLKKAAISDNYNYLIAQAIQFIISVAWSYYWNNKKVFILKEGETRSFWKSLFKTYVSYSFTGLFMNSILLIFWVEILKISSVIAPIFNLVISVPVNFIINKYWAFKKNV